MIVLEACKRADAILEQIHSMVNAWEEDMFVAEEWKVVRKIKEVSMELTSKPYGPHCHRGNRMAESRGSIDKIATSSAASLYDCSLAIASLMNIKPALA